MIGQDVERQAASVYADIGRADRAVALLNSYFSGPTIGYTRFYLTIDPTWDGLRNHAGFRRLVTGESARPSDGTMRASAEASAST